MKTENIFILRILLALSCVVCAAAFIIQTACIYNEAAEQMYTKAIISQHFNSIAWAPAVMLTLIVVGAFLPYPVRKSIVSLDYRMETMLKKVDSGDEKLAAALKTLKLIRILSIALAAVCSIALLLIGTQKTLLVSMDLEYAMGQALPLLLIPAFIMFTGELILDSVKKNISAKIIEIASTMDKLPKEEHKPVNNRSLNILRTALYIAAVILIVAGIVNGGMEGVLVKATVICTECIGLG